MRILMLSIFLVPSFAFGQADTITTANAKLNIGAMRNSKSSYAVFYTDSVGQRTSTADIWDREVKVMKGEAGDQLMFNWNWYKADSLYFTATAVCKFPSLEPVKYTISRKGRLLRSVDYAGDKVAIKGVSAKTRRDTVYNIGLDMPAFVFPMDLEIFSIIPFKRVGQQFVIPFYEPGSQKAGWYHCSVVGRESLKVNSESSTRCWLFRIDYEKNSYATFWIGEKERELLKMDANYNGRRRYKVKLY